MKEIYYPEFEMRSRTMVYQTILLKEQMNFIVPRSYDEELSDNFKKIESIGVFKKYRVEENYRIIEEASDRFINFVERMIEYEKIPNNFFVPKKDDYLIVSQKMPYDFPDRIQKLAFGKKVSKGIIMNKEFAKLYMNYLTDEIVDKQQYVKTTNVSNENQIQQTLSRLYDANLNSNELIRSELSNLVFSMIIPNELYKYSLEDIIKIRNDESYKKALLDFNSLLCKMMDELGENEKPADLRMFQWYDSKIDEYRIIMGEEIQSVLGKITLSSIPIILGCLTSDIPISLAAGGLSAAGIYGIDIHSKKNSYSFTEKAATRKVVNRIRNYKNIIC